jgi:hypothetical protein
MGWDRDDAPGHEGHAAATAPDGTALTAPEGKSSGWWYFNGTNGYPAAEWVTASCECGWHSVALHPIVSGDEDATEGTGWENGRTSGPYADWVEHVTTITGVDIPSHLATAIRELEQELAFLIKDGRGLAAVAVLRRLEKSVEARMPTAVGAARGAGASWADIGKAVETTRQAAHERFRAVTATSTESPRWLDKPIADYTLAELNDHIERHKGDHTGVTQDIVRSCEREWARRHGLPTDDMY